MCRPDTRPPSHGPAARNEAAGRPYRGQRRWTGAALVLLLLTALGLIGHHTLPAGTTPAAHATTPTATASHRHTPDPGSHATAVAAHPVQACAEHRVCSSTAPARGVTLAAPPPAGPGTAGPVDPAPRPTTHPGIPWPGAPPPDLDILSVSRR
ncbi:hypothetical protein ACFP3U_33160 [Kitasatospora misakiensis]|uniref:Serine/threonine protein kinase n=1 Tax=Kitasatospora misakiensis TaxID=67330 RepID=A0ABW0XDI6_9ACTN